MHYFFFFNDTATTEIYTLSLHDALPIFAADGGDADDLDLDGRRGLDGRAVTDQELALLGGSAVDDDLVQRSESTRLNSSHANISYAVFCLKKKKNIIMQITCI